MPAFNLHYTDGRTVNIVSLNRNGNGKRHEMQSLEWNSLCLRRNSQRKVTVTKQ